MTMLIPTRQNKEDNKGLSTFPTLSSWLDEVFNDNFGTEFMNNYNTGISLPAVNVIDRDSEYIVEMAIPGLKKSDFDVTIDNQLLTISAETKTETEDETDNYTRREFGYSSFKRTFTLPKTVNTEKISANYNDGILKVELPKFDEAKKKPSRTIKIS